MSQKDINKDLGQYIKEKHKKEPFWKRIGISKKAINDDAKTKEDKELEEMENKLEEVNAVEEKVEEEINEEREGILKRFFKKLNFGKKEQEYYEPEEEETKEDNELNDDQEIKEFLKSIHAWIIKLDPEIQKEFKNSPDFEKYKKMLKKYGLIKE
ncbi:MAG: hypothetical protein QXL18_00550 [Candidatus Woesearchaeota archaeon]